MSTFGGLPTNAAGTTFQRHRLNLDASGGYRFNQRISFFATVRNVLNTPHILMQKTGANPMVATTFQMFGGGGCAYCRGR